MKIGIFTHNYPSDENDLSNAGIFVFNIAEELAKRNEVWVFCPHELKSGVSEVGKTRVFWFRRGIREQLGSVKVTSIFGFLNLGLFFVRGLIGLAGWRREQGCTQVNVAMWAWPAGFFTLVAKKLYRTPYVVWALGSDINKYAKMPIMGWVVRAILREAEGLYADGVELTKDVTRISGKRCQFLPSSTKVKPVRGKRARRSQKIVLAFLGRMEVVKGPDVLLEALIGIKDKLRGFEIRMIGDGSMFEDLKKKAEKEGIDEAVNFYESERGRNMRLIAGSDWVVIPSRDDSIPLIFSEAMKLGVPIIASDLPDISYLIKKYRVGITFRSEEPGDLAKLIAGLGKRRVERKRMAKNTALAATDFSVEESGRKLYNSLARIGGR